jgi:hypothetical protein
MARKSKTLRNLLSTISSLVVISSGIAQVEAASVKTAAAGVVNLRNNQNDPSIRIWPGGVVAKFMTGDYFVFSQATTITTGTKLNVASIDLNGQAAGGPFTVNNNSTLGSIVDTTGGGNKLNITVNDARSLMLTGTVGLGGVAGTTAIAINDYTGLGNIILGSGGGQAAVAIDCDVTLTGTIDGVGNNQGKLIVKNARAVTFEGAIGATRLNVLQIGENAGGGTAMFADTVEATTIDLKPGSTATFKAAVTTDAMSIGAAGGIATAVLDGAAISINSTATTDTVFGNVDSVLQLQALGGNDNTYTLQNNIDPGVNGNGIIILHADGDNGALVPVDSALTLDGNGGVRTIGINAGNLIKELRATGNKVSTITANVDLKDVPLLNVADGATLVSKSASAFRVAASHIGEATGKGLLTIDTQGVNSALLEGGRTIAFDHPDSMLTITNNVVAANSVITLHANLLPGGVNDLQGNLTIISSNGQTITIAPNTPLAPETIGTSALLRLGSLTVGGDQNTTINVPVYAKKINVGAAGRDTTFGALVNAGAGGEMNVTEDGKVIFSENTEILEIKLGGKNVKIDVAGGKTLSVDKISNPGAGSTLDLIGNGSNLAPYTGGANVDITMDKFRVAAAGSTNNLAKGKYTGDIELVHATGTLELADGVDLEKINSAGGAAATVNFLGSGKVRGVMGSLANPVGVVTVDANGTLELGGDVHATSINGQAGGPNESLKFINAAPITVVGALGTTNKFKEFQFSGEKVTLPAGFVTDKFNFTNPLGTEVATTGANVLQNRAVANTNGGNKITVDENQVINRALGTDANPFGTIHITNGDKTIEIQTADFHAGVTTAAPDAGTVIFNFADAKSLGLGEDVARLNKVKFTLTGSVKGDIFAKDAEVALGQTANIAGSIKGESMHLVGDDSTTNFTEDAVMDTAITADAPGEGIVNFEKKATVSKAITDVREVNFNVDDGATEVILSEGIKSLTTNFKKSKTSITEDLTLDGIANFNGTDISFGQKDLTIGTFKDLAQQGA